MRGTKKEKPSDSELPPTPSATPRPEEITRGRDVLHAKSGRRIYPYAGGTVQQPFQ